METTLESTDRNKASIWSTGLAMFAMFFGAGNIVFPLALGQFTQDKNLFGVAGLIITAVFVPLIGLLSMLLYNGDYVAFFRRIGKVPGFLVAVMILGLIGPFGGIPRCITISYSTLEACGLGGLPGLNLTTFSLASCLVIFFFTFRQNKILSLLGYVLTPILLLSLAVIVVKGFILMPYPEPSSFSGWETFSKGLFDGYNTMDLLAAFFFSSVVLLCLRKGHVAKDIPVAANRRLLTVAFYGSLIAAALLAAVYLSFSFLAAGFSADLTSVPNHQMLGALAYKLLGPYAGMIASVAVSFACLTTEIALTAVFAEYLHETLFKEKVSFRISLLATLGLSFLVSTLRFEGITSFLVPILQVFYPALIVLCVLNVLYKLYGFQPVKRIFYGAAAATLALQLF
ncbi:MAG: branched-chain amino acid transport system II carrier protein [Chlamydiales bacterium]|nr:branched-chain amino acid transport system II carrier protein [Chlamydiales bacterium]